MQNYEGIKQKMLTQTLSELEKEKKAKELANKKELVCQEITGFGFLSSIVKQNQKKRKHDEISGGANNLGRFLYKYKEGHSKNFKRELTFDFFL